MKAVELIIFLFFFLQGCEKRVTRVMEEWEGREILFPTHSIFTIQAEDTVNYPVKEAIYKVLVYVDTIGCTSCKLRLSSWKSFIKEVDSLSRVSVAFYFYLSTKDVKEMRYQLKREQFFYPVCIDTANVLDSLNHFPQEEKFQTFLLDKHNKIILIGNPVRNATIKELYLKQITGKTDKTTFNNDNVRLRTNTKITIANREVDLGKLSLSSFPGKDAVFVLRNTGDIPLLITDVVTFCGCTKVDYPKTFISPGDYVKVTVHFTPDKKGFFQKSVMVHCNASGSPFKLTLKGTVL